MEKQMTRSEHLDWARKRALEFCDKGESLNAWISFRSDMAKHDELRDHIALEIGDKIYGPSLLAGKPAFSNGVIGLRNFIEGFN